MIQLRHGQPSLWHSGLAKDIEDLWEPWMKEVDGLLKDAALLEEVYQAQGKRRRHSRTRGRMQTPRELGNGSVRRHKNVILMVVNGGKTRTKGE